MARWDDAKWRDPTFRGAVSKNGLVDDWVNTGSCFENDTVGSLDFRAEFRSGMRAPLTRSAESERRRLLAFCGAGALVRLS